ncbi:MAG TPA: hypothetical protein VL545_10040, partial [Rhodanobacter sp.]|nr:hypothetical protein [Rhodanobacter sp.]
MLECTLSSPAGVFMVAASAWPVGGAAAVLADGGAGGGVAGMLDCAGAGDAGGVCGTGCGCG